MFNQSIGQSPNSSRTVSSSNPKTFNNDNAIPNTWFFDKQNSKIKSNNSQNFSKVEIGSRIKNQNLFVWGDINHSGSIYNISDKNFKQNIVPLTQDEPDFFKLNPVSYNYIGSSKTHFGFIAQEVEEIYPDLVSDQIIDKEQTKKCKVLNLSEMIPLLVNKIKYMDNKMNGLINKNKQLELEILSTREAILRKINIIDINYESKFKNLKK
jgi:hypothetical protein